MPRVRRVPRVRFDWPPSAVWHLMTGFYISGGFPPETDRETLRVAWSELGGRVFAMLDDVRRRGRGGPFWRIRPWGWWEFDSPEPRDRSMSEGEQLERIGLLDDPDAGFDPGADPPDDAEPYSDAT